MKSILNIAALLIIISACTEKIDIDLGTTYTRLVVEGQITSDTGVHWVNLSKTTDYYFNELPPVISGATVRISDDNGLDLQLQENIEIRGRYETPGQFFGIPGHTYTLDIELPEPVNDQTHYEATCKMRPVAPIDTITVEYLENWEAFAVKIYAQEPPTTDFYAFQIIKNGRLITDTISEVWISDDRYFNGNYTNGVAVYYLFPDNGPDEDVVAGDTITLKMSSITEEYYRFIFELQDQTFDFRNPLFSGPPANVTTNISNEGCGFFAAYSSYYSSTVYQ